jgi:gas vesicle protein
MASPIETAQEFVGLGHQTPLDAAREFVGLRNHQTPIEAIQDIIKQAQDQISLEALEDLLRPQRRKRRSRTRLIVGLIAGLAVGAIVGVMIAPAPGNETREAATTRAMGLKQGATESSTSAVSRARSRLQNAVTEARWGWDVITTDIQQAPEVTQTRFRQAVLAARAAKVETRNALFERYRLARRTGRVEEA